MSLQWEHIWRTRGGIYVECFIRETDHNKYDVFHVTLSGYEEWQATFDTLAEAQAWCEEREAER